jgi:hypothetical protein
MLVSIADAGNIAEFRYGRIIDDGTTIQEPRPEVTPAYASIPG